MLRLTASKTVFNNISHYSQPHHLFLCTYLHFLSFANCTYYILGNNAFSAAHMLKRFDAWTKVTNLLVAARFHFTEVETPFCRDSLLNDVYVLDNAFLIFVIWNAGNLKCVVQFLYKLLRMRYDLYRIACANAPRNLSFFLPSKYLNCV